MTDEELEALIKEQEAFRAQDDPNDTRSLIDKGIDFVTGDYEEQRLEKRGIQTEGAPAGSRLQFSGRSEDRLFNTMKKLDTTEQAEFKIDPKGGKMLFRTPQDTQWNTINPPGIDWGDLAEMIGETGAMVGEALGYIISKKLKLKNPKRSTDWLKERLKSGGGIFAGGTGGEALRQTVAKDVFKEQEHLTPEETADRLLKDSPIAGAYGVAGAAAMRGVGDLGKKGLAYARGKRVPTDVVDRALALGDPKKRTLKGAVDAFKSEDNTAKKVGLPWISHNVSVPLRKRFKNAWNYLRSNKLELPGIVKEVNDFLAQAGRTERFNPDSARLLDDPQFMEALDQLAKNRGLLGHKAVRESYEGNESALTAMLDETNKRVGTGTIPTYQAGSAVGKAVGAQGEQAERTMANRVGKGIDQMDQADLAVQQKAGARASTEFAGDRVRYAPEKEYRDFLKKYEKEYQALADEVGGRKFNTDPLYKLAKKELEVLDDDILKGLSEQDRALFESLKSGTSRQASTPSGGQYEAPAFKSYGSIQRLLSQVKRAERDVNTGITSAQLREPLRKIKEAAMDTRTRQLEQMSPELQKKHLDLEDRYFKEKERLSEGMAGKLIRYKNGRPVISGEKVFSSIFGPDKTHDTFARETMRVLGDGKYINELRAIKDGIFEEFSRLHITGNGKINTKAATKWMDERKHVLKRYLNPDEIATLQTSKNRKQVAEGLTKRKILFDKAMKKAVGAKYRKMDSDQIFEAAWKNADSVAHLKRALKKFPQEWEMFKNAGLKRLKSDITEFDPTLERQTVSFFKLNRILDNDSQVRKLETLYGKEYVGNLKRLRRAAVILARSPGKVRNTNDPWINTIRKVAFGPLDHKSFAIRVIGAKRAEVQAGTLMNVVLDPQLLNSAARAITTTEKSKIWQAILGSSMGESIHSGSVDDVALDNKRIKALLKNVENDPVLKKKLLKTR